MSGLFITGTGTGVGKTWVMRGLARALARKGQSPRAFKPIETGIETRAEDAMAIARASQHPSIEEGAYRARPPAAPLSITLRGEHEPLVMDILVQMIERERALGWLLVEGAGGLLVPLTPTETIADLAAAARLPLVLVSRDELGTLSHTLAAVECAERRDLEIRAVVLTSSSESPAAGDNVGILRRLLEPLPVLRFGAIEDDDDALAAEAERCGLLSLALGL